jgi:hypothetical protein
MVEAQKRQSASVVIPQAIKLGKKPMIVKGFNKKGTLVCTLKITAAGLSFASGPSGNWWLVKNESWDKFSERLLSSTQS